MQIAIYFVFFGCIFLFSNFVLFCSYRKLTSTNVSDSRISSLLSDLSHWRKNCPGYFDRASQSDIADMRALPSNNERIPRGEDQTKEKCSSLLLARIRSLDRFEKEKRKWTVRQSNSSSVSVMVVVSGKTSVKNARFNAKLLKNTCMQWALLATSKVSLHNEQVNQDVITKRKNFDTTNSFHLNAIYCELNGV